MLQWRNWHTRQIQTLFSPGSTPGWSTIFEINSGGDFVNNISAVAIGMLIAAHREGDEEKFRAYVELIAETYEQQGNDHAANIIRSNYTGDYGEQGKVILDEATASVDPENEAQIQKALSALTAGKTLIVIAHRLSTIVDADQIIVIENGCVAGCGKQEELLADCPLYANMWKAHQESKDRMGEEEQKDASNN